MQDIVLCKIYRKATSLKVLEQRAATEEEMKLINASSSSSPLSSLDNMSFSSQQEESVAPVCLHHVVFKTEVEEDICVGKNNTRDEKLKEIKGSSIQLPVGNDKLPELEVPKLSMDWNQDNNFWLNSPWLQSLAQNLAPYANILNF